MERASVRFIDPLGADRRAARCGRLDLSVDEKASCWHGEPDRQAVTRLDEQSGLWAGLSVVQAGELVAWGVQAAVDGHPGRLRLVRVGVDCAEQFPLCLLYTSDAADE